MSRTVESLLRLLPLALCYLVFGGGSLLAFAMLWPLELMPLPRLRKQKLARIVVRFLFRFFVWFIQLMGLITIVVEGVEHLESRPRHLVVANHPTLIDILVLVSLFPDAICIVKADLERSVVFRAVVRATGYLTNSSAETLLTGCAQALERGSTVILFPEGTRSVPGRPLRFLRGAAQIALRCGHDLTPIVIDCNPPVLMKNQSWYEFARHRSVQMTLKVEPFIPVLNFALPDEGIPLASRKLTRHLTDYFQRRLSWPIELQREQ